MNRTILIDPDANVAELIEQWRDGNKTAVLRALTTDHAALAALLIVIGAQDGTLSLGDCNEIANRLGDDRKRMADTEQPTS